MNNIDKIVEHIKAQTIEECEDISRTAAEECEHIHAEFARLEQEEYWKAIDIGTKETEQRLESLKELAAAEAKKQIDSLHNEMLDKAFALAAQKLLALPKGDFDALLIRLGTPPGISPDALLALYRTELTPDVISALFD